MKPTLYLIVALAIACALLFGVGQLAWSLYGKVRDLRVELDALNQSIEQSTESLLKLDSTIGAAHAELRKVKTTISELETSNPELSDHLDTPVPVDIQRVLNEQRSSE
tara:strand:+ start:14565 stop:14888 length:324 start_codon:yes stop_codon:yes gene_type:complete